MFAAIITDKYYHESKKIPAFKKEHRVGLYKEDILFVMMLRCNLQELLI